MIVTKTMLYNFLDKKREEALNQVEAAFNKKVDNVIDGYLSDPESVAAKAARKIAEAYIQANNGDDEFYTALSKSDTYARRYSRVVFKNIFQHASILENVDEVTRFIFESYYETTDEYMAQYNMKSKMNGQVNKEYDKLTENVKSMKNGKEGVKYLKELGFDVSALDEEKTEAFLVNPIDTRYLMIKKEA